jgi:hypothetical protein
MPLLDVQILEDLGFAWERSEYQWAHVIAPALIAYKEAHCFIVPAEEP